MKLTVMMMVVPADGGNVWNLMRRRRWSSVADLIASPSPYRLMFPATVVLSVRSTLRTRDADESKRLYNHKISWSHDLRYT